ncbi:hypothetical protein [Xanthomonas cannabis]|uniref:hypothetical protein n=1 Tax=Xanthomonas cannabis TaxID=1885674 RepID=UPI0033B4CB67
MSDGRGRSTEGFGVDRESSVRLIVKTALENGVTDPKQISYMLATAQHETRNFQAPEEDFGRSQARKLGYSGRRANLDIAAAKNFMAGAMSISRTITIMPSLTSCLA